MYTISQYVELPKMEGNIIWSHPVTGMKIGLNNELCTIVKHFSGDIIASKNIENNIELSDEFICLFCEELIYRGFLVPQKWMNNELDWHSRMHPFMRQRQSFFQMPIALIDALPDQAKFVFFGVPYDDAATHPGTRYGPNLIRSKSLSYSFRNNDHKGIYSLRKNRYVFDKNKCFDIGDLNLDSVEYEERLKILKEKVVSLPSKSIPIMIGGDHSYSYAAVSAICERYVEDKVTMVQFDSHLDLQVWPSLKEPELDPIRHSNFVSHLLNDNKNLNIVQAGIRNFQSVNNDSDSCFIPDFPGLRTSIFSDLDLMFDKKELLSVVGKRNKVYISLDIDCLRDIVNTGYPASVGMTVDTLLYYLHFICTNNDIIGIDIMEFGSSKNHDTHNRESELVNYIILTLIEWIN